MSQSGDEVAKAIRESGLGIYDDLGARPNLIYPTALLEARLEERLAGLDLAFPLRTRSLVAKTAVAEALGYTPPASFTKTQPQFPGQNLDIYVQKANNVQVWNQEVDAGRRYAFLRVDSKDRVAAVRVISGAALALLDRTGTLTSKFQASRRSGRSGSFLVSRTDTDRFQTTLQPEPTVAVQLLAAQSAAGAPVRGQVLSIDGVYTSLTGLTGSYIGNPGHDQERLRGVELQRQVCLRLGIGHYADGGQFPDLLSQALEVKLQMAPTIDLGLVSPDSQDVATEVGAGLRHCDVRYAVVYGVADGPDRIRLTDVVVTTGESFFAEFQRFEGRIQNRKLQIPLPVDFFDAR